MFFCVCVCVKYKASKKIKITSQQKKLTIDN